MNARRRPKSSQGRFDLLVDAALRLKARDRAGIADLLLESLSHGTDLGPEWAAEVGTCFATLGCGGSKAIPWAKVRECLFRKTLLRRRDEMRSGRVKGLSLEQCRRALERQAANRRSH